MIRVHCQTLKSINRIFVFNNRCYSVNASEKRDSEWDKANPYEKIPGPSKFELIRGFFPGGKFQDLTMVEFGRYMRSQHGNIVRIPGVFGQGDLLLTCKPEISEKVFRTEGIHPERRGLEIFIHYRTRVRPEIFGGLGGLLTETGQNWYDIRTKANPVMLQPKVVRMYFEKVDQVACDFIDRIKKLRNRETNEMSNKFGHELNKYALESIGVIALDERLETLSDDSPDGQRIIDSVKKFLALSFELEVGVPFWKLYKSAKYKELMAVFDYMTETIMKYIDRAIERLDAKGNSVDDSNRSVLEKLLLIDRKVAILMAYDMILAGVDTTAATLACCLYYLSQNPDKQIILREEVLKSLPEKDSKFTAEILNHMPYMRACIKESLRISPVIPLFIRKTGQDIVLEGYQVPKGIDVGIAIHALHNDPKYFYESDKFVPERWLRDNPAGKLDNPFVYLPFGFGPRSCIGRRFAEMEMITLLSRIIRNFNVEYHYGSLNFSKKSLFLTPDEDLKFKFIDI